ncbi:MAG: DNA primase [Planctomycetes bacterium]|nr:DNA primase [Planctomycetota bacterium]
MGRVARESIEEVRRANDIVDVINAYVPLQKRGSHFLVNCPFHDEKTPSFTVSPQRQTYKCFGCGVYGNVIDFVMEYEKLDFREALEKLADRGGVTLAFEGGRGPSREERSTRAKALDMMEWAQRGFTANLAKHEGAQKYLADRGLGGEVAERWGLGYAPDEFHRQSDAARKKFDEETILATGLCKRNERGWYDFFRGRLTFPIRDARGRIVGFGARLLDPEAKAQKYVNSAEGLLFHKSKLLYGVDKLAQSQRLKETGRVLLMEGYTDVIAAHEAGFDNSVAPLGTALTREQVGLARRYGEGVTLVLDGDEAGLHAAERGVNVVLEMGVDAKVAVLPEGKDPFDMLRTDGAEAFGKVIGQARDAFDFKLDLIRRRYDLNRPVEAEKALREIADMVGRAESPSLRELYARRAATALNVREGAVLSAVEAEHVKHAELAARSTAAEQAWEDQPPRPQVGEAPGGGRAAHERDVLRALFEHPRAISSAGAALAPEALSTPGLRELYREMLNAWDERGEVVPGALLSHLENGARLELERVLEHIRIPADLGSTVDEEEERRLVQELQKLAESAAQKEQAHDLAELRQKKGRKSTRRA